MSYVPITAAQALEWAKEDIAAQLTTEHPEASSARNEGIGAAIEVLDRWIRRVQDTKPTSRYALAPETRDHARKVAGLD
jgi:hypothetical protein